MSEEKWTAREHVFFENLGRNIRKYRETIGMNGEQLSLKSGVNVNMISKIEAGIMTNLKFGTLLDLCAALNIRPYHLFDSEKEG